MQNVVIGWPPLRMKLTMLYRAPRAEPTLPRRERALAERKRRLDLLPRPAQIVERLLGVAQIVHASHLVVAQPIVPALDVGQRRVVRLEQQRVELQLIGVFAYLAGLMVDDDCDRGDVRTC